MKIKVAMIGLQNSGEEGEDRDEIDRGIHEIAERVVKWGIDVKTYLTPKKNRFQHISSVIKPHFSDCNILHIHTKGPTFLGALSLLSKKKTITTLYDLSFHKREWMQQIYPWSLREWITGFFSDHLIFPLSCLKDYFKEKYPSFKVSVIPNGCGEKRSFDSLSPIPELPSKHYFLYLGKIIPESGLHLLIQTYKSLNTPFPLIIGGAYSPNDPYFAYLRLLSHEDPRIRFIGKIEGSYQERVLRHAHLLILPTEKGSFSSLLLKASELEVCIALSKSIEGLEILREGDQVFSLVFSPHSQEELKAVFEISLNLPEFVEMLGKQAKSHILDHYHWDILAERTKTIYENVLKS